MKTISIMGVPEHFNFPWTEVVKSQPFAHKGIELIWKDESKGSGAMNKAIREGDAEIAIILTESFIKDKIEGNPGKIIGWHVKSPLIWGIHVSESTKVNTVPEVENAPFLISRYGSGSHLMAYVLAEREGWKKETLSFELVGNMDGAKKVFIEEDMPKIFLWEKFTTKPLVDEGIFKRIGEIPTPWPCFVIVASEKILNKNREVVRELQHLVYQKSKELITDPQTPERIASKYGIQLEDIKEWIKQTIWAQNSTIESLDLENTMNTLKELNLIKNKIKPTLLVDEELGYLK